MAKGTGPNRPDQHDRSDPRADPEPDRRRVILAWTGSPPELITIGPSASSATRIVIVEGDRAHLFVWRGERRGQADLFREVGR